MLTSEASGEVLKKDLDWRYSLSLGWDGVFSHQAVPISAVSFYPTAATCHERYSVAVTDQKGK